MFKLIDCPYVLMILAEYRVGKTEALMGTAEIRSLM